MKSRFILFRRGEMFYCEDTETGKQTSLKTKDKTEAHVLLNARNESFRQPVLNLQIARAYLTAGDPAFSQRTWQSVMDQMQTHGKDSTKTRCARAMQSKAFDRLRGKALVETNAEDLLAILNGGKVSVAHYLKRLHNLALGLGWLAVPALAPRLWPKPQFKSKRGITEIEHLRILEAEKNPERNLFYQLLWEIGSSQSDATALTAEIWLIFSGLCLRLYEEEIYRREFHQMLDTVDGLITSTVQSDIVERFETPSNSNATRQSQGIPTGLGRDIEQHVEQRKRNPRS